jgi:hypothetical protein
MADERVLHYICWVYPDLVDGDVSMGVAKGFS